MKKTKQHYYESINQHDFIDHIKEDKYNKVNEVFFNSI